MSWQATAYVAEITEGITRSEKTLLLCLANRHNTDKGTAWVSVSRLARESLMSERTCYRLLDSLENKGVIAINTRPGMTSEYVILGLNRNVTPDMVSGVATDTDDRGTPDKSARKWQATPDKSSVTPDIAMADEPAVEPILNSNEPADQATAAVQDALANRHPIFLLYEQYVGPVYPVIHEELVEIAQTFPEPWIIAAFQEARAHNARRPIAYARRCLEKWSRDGRAETDSMTDNSARAQMLRRFQDIRKGVAS